MKYKSQHKLLFLQGLTTELAIPFQIGVGGCQLTIYELAPDRSSVSVSLEGPVDPFRLTIIQPKDRMDGSTRSSAIVVPEAEQYQRLLNAFANIYSFILDMPLRVSTRLEASELIPESAEDREYLESHPEGSIHQELHLIPAVRTFVMQELSDEAAEEFLRRDIGFALYAQALGTSHAILSYLTYWKILEAAFRQKGERLAHTLSQFSLAKQMDFTLKELKGLLALRGRAAHAYSRAGLGELDRVSREAAAKRFRLKCIAEQVLLNKKHWGDSSLETRRLAPIESYIDSNGGIVLYRRKSAMPNSACS